jgi:hypothetical protein
MREYSQLTDFWATLCSILFSCISRYFNLNQGKKETREREGEKVIVNDKLERNGRAFFQSPIPKETATNHGTKYHPQAENQTRHPLKKKEW